MMLIHLNTDAKPHYGDFALFHIVDLTLLVEAGSLDATPSLKSWYNTMKSLPAVSAYLARRSGPSTEGFGVPGSYFMGTK
jgi:glutathione S-transferase